jgi:hypothetical protein
LRNENEEATEKFREHFLLSYTEKLTCINSECREEDVDEFNLFNINFKFNNAKSIQSVVNEIFNTHSPIKIECMECDDVVDFERKFNIIPKYLIININVDSYTRFELPDTIELFNEKTFKLKGFITYQTNSFRFGHYMYIELKKENIVRIHGYSCIYENDKNEFLKKMNKSSIQTKVLLFEREEKKKR